MNFLQYLPTPEAVLDLEPEDLAGFLLEWANDGSGDSLNANNFCLMLDGLYKHDERVGNAFMEAWMYLLREGLLVEKPKSPGWYFVSRRGRRLKGRQDLQAFRRAAVIQKQSLHPLIAERAWPTFLRGEYDTAVFQAFKEVEVAVRNATGLADTDIGVDLMGKAFNYASGRLAEMSRPEAERRAMAALFSGAIGLFKNPSSHRHVSISDPGEAAEMLMFASLLLRIVDAQGSATVSP